MSNIYDQPKLHRQRTMWLAAAGGAALLLVAVAAIAITSMGDDAPAATAAAAGTPAKNAPLQASSLPAGAAVITAEPAPAAVVAPVATPATFTLGHVSGAPLVPVEAPLRLVGAEGLGSASLKLTYDPSVVTVTGVAPGNVPQGALTWHHDAASGTIVLLATTSLPDGMQGDVTFATLTFEAKDGAVGEVSPLALTVRGGAHADGSAADLRATDGSFRNGLAGDVLGDGTVDQADYERLAAFLVGEDVDIVQLNADLDGDGAVTDADAVRLHQFLDGARDSP